MCHHILRYQNFIENYFWNTVESITKIKEMITIFGIWVSNFLFYDDNKKIDSDLELLQDKIFVEDEILNIYILNYLLNILHYVE